MKTMRLLLPGVLVVAVAFATPLQNSDSSFTSKAEHLPEHHKGPTELELFLEALGHQESGNRYHVTNRYGYMGKYQFGKSTLTALGYNVSRTEFLSSPEIQEAAMISLLEHNRENMKYYIDKYEGKTINGIHVTESGLLAAAHLVGPRSVKEFLRTGKIAKDGNNVPLTLYMDMFGGFEIGPHLTKEDYYDVGSIAP